MKIGVVTYFHPINYGAFLQAYALTGRLNQIDGVDAELVNFRYPIEDAWYSRTSWKYLRKNRFNPADYFFDKKMDAAFASDRKKLTLSDNEIISSDIEKFVSEYSGKYDIMIAGSDEIWKATGYRGFPTVYWLPGELKCRKLSYAASARIDFSKLSDDKQAKIRKYLSEFDVIGVRDAMTEESVRLFTDNQDKVIRCCDPVFVYDFKPDRELGRKLLKERFNVDVSKPVVGIMANSKTISENLKKAYGSEFELVSFYKYNNGFINLNKLSPLEWVNVIAGLDFMITRFFHATSFSLISGTPFLAVDTHAKSKNDSKIIDLLSHFNMQDRCVSDVDVLSVEAIRQIVLNGIEKGRDDNNRQILQFRENFEKYLHIADIVK